MPRDEAPAEADPRQLPGYGIVTERAGPTWRNDMRRARRARGLNGSRRKTEARGRHHDLVRLVLPHHGSGDVRLRFRLTVRDRSRFHRFAGAADRVPGSPVGLATRFHG
jgi:hypothetical protein